MSMERIKKEKFDKKTLNYILKAPLILSPPREEWSIPKALKEKITKSRIENILSGDFNDGLSSIADMVIHLYDASLKYPIPSVYVKIYIYFLNELLDGKVKEANIEVDELNDYEKSIANDLRRKILSVQLRYMKKKI